MGLGLQRNGPVAERAAPSRTGAARAVVAVRARVKMVRRMVVVWRGLCGFVL